MKEKFFIFFLAAFFLSQIANAYRIEGGQFFMAGGLGANVNVVRMSSNQNATPRADMPLLLSLDYAIDSNFGTFITFVPHFSSGSVAFAVHGGAKYWFSFLQAPYVPYISLAVTPTFTLPTNNAPKHFNVGLSPGVGVNYFVMSDFLVGIHTHFNPSLAMANNQTNFEFSVTSFLDISFKI